MVAPRLRKVALKRVLDATLTRGVVRDAESVLVVSELEAAAARAAGVARERIVVRGLGFPSPDDVPPEDGSLRRALGVTRETLVILYVGRIAAGKGIEHLLAAARATPDAHLALLGPDDRHGTSDLIAAAMAEPALAGRIHRLPPTEGPPLAAYREASVFVLASAGDSFGLAAAEAAAAGAPVIVTDRCGIASFFEPNEAIVVYDDCAEVVGAITRVLGDAALRATLSAGAVAAARRNTWSRATDIQELAYRRAASRTTSTNDSTLGP
jgi:glycosyltransferase involved in cell wall biosynthesis